MAITRCGAGVPPALGAQKRRSNAEAGGTPTPQELYAIALILPLPWPPPTCALLQHSAGYRL